MITKHFLLYYFHDWGWGLGGGYFRSAHIMTEWAISHTIPDYSYLTGNQGGNIHQSTLAVFSTTNPFTRAIYITKC